MEVDLHHCLALLVSQGSAALSAPALALLSKTPKQWTAADRQTALAGMSAALLAAPEAVVRCCRPLGPELLARALAAGAGPEAAERAAWAASRVVRACPHLAPAVVAHWRSGVPSPLSWAAGVDPASEGRLANVFCAVADLYSQAETRVLSRTWGCAPCARMLASSNARVRAEAARVVAAAIGSGSVSSDPAAALAATEQSAVEAASAFMNDSAWPSGAGTGAATRAEDFTAAAHVVVAGVALPKRRDCRTRPGLNAATLVETATTTRNLRALALAVSQGTPVLLEGPTGSGKTALIEHLARCTSNHDMVKIHLGDQTDAKALLGSYVATEIPSEFRWQEGALAQAVRRGLWVVIEDADLAPLDVLSVLVPLLESRKLFVPGRGDVVEAAPGFQLFATRALLAGAAVRKQGQQGKLLEGQWSRVAIEPLSPAELREVLCSLHPQIEAILPQFLSTWEALVELWAHKGRLTAAQVQAGATPVPPPPASAFSRPLSCRDLFKVEYYSQAYRPTLTTSPSDITVGRVFLERLSQKPERCAPFALTGHSLRLLERVSACVNLNEPVLLVGETGCGKTSVVQHLASLCGVKLVVQNLSQQSDSSDLLGGFRPIEPRLAAIPLRESFEKAFTRTFSKAANASFLAQVRESCANQDWTAFAALLRKAMKQYNAKISSPAASRVSPTLREEWKNIAASVSRFDAQRKGGSGVAFAFTEGALVGAVRRGDWVLLDEANLASAETLEGLAGLLEGGSLTLSEAGAVEPIARHERFRIFACMNPPTDVGKRELPPGLRGRFTEIYVDEPVATDDLSLIVKAYISNAAVARAEIINAIVQFHQKALELASKSLTDGAGQKTHYSLRTLARACQCTAKLTPHYGFARSLYEGFCLSYLTQVNGASCATMEALIKEKLVKGVGLNEKALRSSPPNPGDEYVMFEGFWVPLGPEPVKDEVEFIVTESTRKHLASLARAVVSGGHPVLLQGPTSAGKTSMVAHLARKTGHKLVRINNHEHTDVHEYLGSYESDSSGRLSFREGVLVEAVRKGHWILLDELNLAPSEVLEALNRLLDANRELFIPETQEAITAHPHFMLFATQNPAGLYGGRKALSRAFRNRFVEVHVDDYPEAELQFILEKRCIIPPSYSKLLVAIMKDLQRNRAVTEVFAGRHAFITLRDLFRWALRKPNGHEELAAEGYALLAERLRRDDDRNTVRQVLEKHLRVKIDPARLYDGEAALREQLAEECGVVWTPSMRRLFSLVGRCLKHSEPVLIVGETGCGKTTVCQLWAHALKRRLRTLNCHQNTETADFIGGVRPVRGKELCASRLASLIRAFLKEVNVAEPEGTDMRDLIEAYQSASSSDLPQAVEELHGKVEAELKEYQSLFAWADGPLVEAMRSGDVFLTDEISLADDAVLERLNSVLEPGRTMFLAERGGSDAEEVHAHDDFRMVATMNPGGDFGKRELSPAMRSRFTEIWAAPSAEDAERIVADKLGSQLSASLAHPMVSFSALFLDRLRQRSGSQVATVSIRDLLAWVSFVRTRTSQGKATLNASYEALVHGACMVLLDGIGSGTGMNEETANRLRKELLLDLVEMLPEEHRAVARQAVDAVASRPVVCVNAADRTFTAGPFSVPLGPLPAAPAEDYALDAPTTASNAARVLRGMQLPKAILLEGSPGVGKTSLISALARASGHRLTRINLGEQTDMSDLLGADLPAEGTGARAGEFSWRDGALLAALRAGEWVLLDELNLAPQTVLEGLNSVLDHRAEIFIPELSKSFTCAPGWRVFACQNPVQQGGGRRGLPKSFLNRFTRVRVEALGSEDLIYATRKAFPTLPEDTLRKVIEFNTLVGEEASNHPSFARRGAPWEFNLRDVFRWCELMTTPPSGSAASTRTQFAPCDPAMHVGLIYGMRMRTAADREHLKELFQRVFAYAPPQEQRPLARVTPSWVQVGYACLRRGSSCGSADSSPLELLHNQTPALEAVLKCAELGWLCIVIGSTAAGKTSLVRMAARLAGRDLREFAMNSAVDTTELLGGFEQVDPVRGVAKVMTRVERLADTCCRCLLRASDKSPKAAEILAAILSSAEAMESRRRTFAAAETTFDIEQLSFLKHLCDAVKSAQSLNLVDLEELPEDCTPDAVVEAAETLHSAPTNCSGRFEWNDGVLIQALEAGDWLLVDNVNFCPSTVLDRLNPLLEPGGVLQVSERGVVDGKLRTVKPHKNFRIFFAMDPANGDISRAMRNRGLEVCLLDSDAAPPERDSLALLGACGVPGGDIPRAMLAFHEAAAELRLRQSQRLQTTVRDLVHWARLAADQARRGAPAAQALREGAEQVYVRPCRRAADAAEISALYTERFAASLGAVTPAFGEAGLWPIRCSSASSVAADPLFSSVALNCSPATHQMLLLAYNNAGSPMQSDRVACVSPDQLCEAYGAQRSDVSVIVERERADEERFKAALNHAVRSACADDWRARCAWLASWPLSGQAAALRNVAIALLEQLFAHQLSRTVVQSMNSVSSSLGYPTSLVELQPICAYAADPLRVAVFSRSTAADTKAALEQYDGAKSRIARLLPRLARKLAEKAALDAAVRADLAHPELLSPMQRSWLFATGKIKFEALARPWESIAYPLIDAVEEAASRLLENPASALPPKDLVDARDSLFDALASPDARDEDMQWRWSALRRAIRDAPDAFSRASQLSSRAGTLLAEAHASPTALWRKIRPQPLRRAALWALHEALQGLARKLDAAQCPADEGSRNHVAALATAETRRTLLEAVCNLRWHSEESEAPPAISDAVAALRSVVEALENKCKAVVAPAEFMDADDDEGGNALLRLARAEEDSSSELRHGVAALWPLVDHWATAREHRVVCAVQATGVQQQQAGIESIVRELVAGNAPRSPCDYVPATLMAWTVSKVAAGAPLPAGTIDGLVTEAVCSFGGREWLNTFNELPKCGAALSGPARLYQGVRTILAFEMLGQWDEAPLRLVGKKAKQVTALREHLLTAQLPQSSTALEADAAYCRSVLAQTLTSFEKLLPQAHADGIDVAALVAAAASCSDPRLSSVAKEFLTPAIEVLATRPTLMSVGKALALVGAARVELLAPPLCDPTAKHASKLASAEHRMAAVGRQADAAAWVESVCTGRKTTEEIEEMRREQSGLADLSKRLAMRAIERPQPPSYPSLRADALRYMTTTGARSKVLGLVRTLEKGADVDTALAQEALWQSAAQRFAASLSQRYAALADMVLPMRRAVYECMHGLRLMAQARASATPAPTVPQMKELASWLTEFPRLWSTESSLAVVTRGRQLAVRGVESRAVLVAALDGLRHRARTAGYVGEKELEALDAVFTAFTQEWTAAEDERRAKEEAEAAAFTVKAKDLSLGDSKEYEEAEEKQQMLEMFPDFSDEFTDITRVTSKDPEQARNVPTVPKAAGQQSQQQQQGVRVTDDDAELLRQVHNELFGGDGGQPLKPSARAVDDSPALPLSQYRTARAVIEALGPHVPAGLDDARTGLHVIRAMDVTRQMTSAATVAKKDDSSDKEEAAVPFDVYRENRAGEVAVAVVPLEAMVARLERLLSQWPENVVLQSLMALCQRILSFSVLCPLMKFLVGLEMLVTQSQLWESTASRAVSLVEELARVSSVVARWRALELRSWPWVLRSREALAARQANRWWFHLHATLFAPAGSARPSVDDVVRSCGELVATSSMGDFAARLALVKAFAGQLSRSARDDADRELVRAMLGVHAHYAQFSRARDEALAAARAPLQKDLDEFMKLAHWERVDYYALRDTANKSHRKLVQISRAYDRVLAKSVADILSREPAAPQWAPADPADALCGVPRALPACAPDSLCAVPAPLADAEVDEKFASHAKLENLAMRMRTMGAKRVVPAAAGRVAEGCEAVAEASEGVAQHAAVIAEPTTTKQSRAQKKLALTQMLRTLCSVGLSRRASSRAKLPPTTTEALMSAPDASPAVARVFGDAALEIAHGQPAGKRPECRAAVLCWSVADAHFRAGAVRLQRLRRTTPHKDVSLREATAGLGLAEHAAAIALEQRQQLSAACDSLASSLALCRSLHELADCPEGLTRQSAARAALSSQRAWLVQAPAVFADCSALLRCCAGVGSDKSVADLSAASAELAGLLRSLRTECGAVVTPPATRDIGAAADVVRARAAMLEDALGQVPEHVRGGADGYAQRAQELADSWSRAACERPASGSAGAAFVTEFCAELENLVNSLLVAAQNLSKVFESCERQAAEEAQGQEQKEGQDEKKEQEENLLLTTHAKAMAMLHEARLPEVRAALARVLEMLSSRGDGAAPAGCVRAAARAHALAHMYLHVASSSVSLAAALHAQTSRLFLQTVQAVSGVLERGLGVQDGDDKGEGGVGDTEEASGTGMGEGVGEQDVSDQIQSADQLQGDSAEKKEPEQQKAPQPDEEDLKKGFEMDEDFEGEMEDVPEETEEEKQRREEERGDESEEEPEHEKKLGEVDDDKADRVDKQFWDEEDEQEDMREELEEGQGEQQDMADADEMMGMDDDQSAAPEDKKQPKEKKKQDKRKEDALDKKPEDGEGDGGDDDEQGSDGEDQGEAEFEQENQADAMPEPQPEPKPEDTELPDEMKLDDVKDDKKQQDDSEDAEDGESDDEQDAGDDKGPEPTGDAAGDEQLPQSEKDEEDPEAGTVEHPEAEKGPEAQEHEAEEEQQPLPEGAEAPSSKQQTYGVDDDLGRPSDALMDDDRDDSAPHTGDAEEDKRPRGRSTAAGEQDASGLEEGRAPESSGGARNDKRPPMPAPAKALDSAVREWRRRLNVLAGEEVVEREGGEDMDVGDDDEQHGDDQQEFAIAKEDDTKEREKALAPALEKDAEALPDAEEKSEEQKPDEAKREEEKPGAKKGEQAQGESEASEPEDADKDARRQNKRPQRRRAPKLEHEAEEEQQPLPEGAEAPSSKQQTYGVDDDLGRPSDALMDDDRDDSAPHTGDAEEDKRPRGRSTAAGEQDASGLEEGRAPESSGGARNDKRPPMPAPAKALDSAVREWRRRLNVLAGEEVVEREGGEDMDVGDDDEQHGDDQQEFAIAKEDDTKEREKALAPALEKDAEALPDAEEKSEEQKPDEAKREEEKPGAKKGEQAQGESEASEPEDADKDARRQNKRPQRRRAPKLVRGDQNDEEMPDADAAATDEPEQDEARADDEQQPQRDDTVSSGHRQREEEEEQAAADALAAAEGMSAEDLARMREELDAYYSKWRLSSGADAAGEVWRACERAVGRLSAELCEQLRVILEPTLATQLRGDYRTGKRINMRRVIPYIASGFKKDKIWLRRTRPHKRTYQVLLAIDDSESMKQNRAGGMALEALALIAGALTKLEVGELGVVRFGEEPSVVHTMSPQFTEQDGTQVVSRFTFAQKGTSMQRLVSLLVQMLESSRAGLASSSLVEHQQIVFVVSDGRFGERDGLRAWVREAEARHMLIVFIIVDCGAARDSILELKSVSYPNGKLTVTPYIDQFPFPYYIILRDIATLPDTLAAALRQWFELLKNSE
eukprot:m51a1_g9152 hypothetical protein (5493) ;mRNA; r:105121-123237